MAARLLFRAIEDFPHGDDQAHSVPFDVSQQALLAAPFVRILADRFPARVTLCSVIPPVWDVAPMGIPVTAALEHVVHSRSTYA